MLNFRGNKDLCKLTKEYLNALLCKFSFHSLQHSETFDVSHVFLSLTNAAQTGPVFLADPVGHFGDGPNIAPRWHRGAVSY